MLDRCPQPVHRSEPDDPDYMLPLAGGGVCDPPPLKWSALRYGFRAKEDHDAEEETFNRSYPSSS
jgi:hypothetical protein